MIDETVTLSHLQYIAVEGPIGVGSTTLARALADHLGAESVMEPIDDVPFLGEFYQDTDRYALATQLSFLLARIRQQDQITELKSRARQVISDYIFAKDDLYAKLVLSPPEIALYTELVRQLGPVAPEPDMVVYLQASVETLVDRVRQRGAQYEDDMDQDYLSRVIDGYNNYFFHDHDAALLVVNTNEIDFVNSHEDLTSLIEQIARTGNGTRYYVSTSSDE